MRVGRVINGDLLAVIARAGEISYEELRKIYLEPEVQGVVQGKNINFDNDLKDLEFEFRITIENGIIKIK